MYTHVDMALIDIRTFEKKNPQRIKVHDYAAATDYVVFSNPGDSDPNKRTILQINMYGSEERQCQGVASQTIQIDKAVARQLMKIFVENDMF